MSRFRSIALSAALVAATIALAPPPAMAAPAGSEIPSESIIDTGLSAASGDTYIVKFRAGADRGAGMSAARGAGVRVQKELAHVFDGAIVTGSAADAEELRRQPNVESVEASAPISAADVQSNPTWGLDRIDQRKLPLDQRYTYYTKATNVTAYVIDTGMVPHVEFTGRIPRGAGPEGDWRDCSGHGTHVAGTIGGTNVGVAKGVKLIPVKVLDCEGNGNTSTLVAAIDWVISDIKAHPGLAVANFSLTGGRHDLVDQAVGRLISAGVTTAIAAGNFNDNACSYSPARVAAAVTVANSNSADAQNPTSNHGTCVDLYAPGTNIYSAVHTSSTAYGTYSGTSMAAPHVAGVAALIQSQNPTWKPAQVNAEVLRTSTPNVITNPSTGTPNKLLFSIKPPTAVTPKAATFADLCGTQFDRYTIPATTGVNYLVNGAAKAAGTYAATGKVAVTTTAMAGYSLSGTTSWSKTFSAATTFSDVAPTTQFSQEICWMAINKISTGYPDGTYQPVQPVNRDAMAAFMYRLAGSPAFTPPAKSPFKDVTPTTQFYKEITWLAAKKITTGYDDGTYRPTQPVNRDAMAAFMYRLAGNPAWTAPATSPFKDVTPKTQFYKEITWLAAKKITTGYDDRTYRPVQRVNRDAMAAFMYRLKAVNKLV